MHRFLNDPIDVIVSFAGRKVRPTKLFWDNRFYELTQVNMIHKAQEGTKQIFYFSVSDHVNAFKLKLDTELLEWRLVEVYEEA